MTASSHRLPVPRCPLRPLRAEARAGPPPPTPHPGPRSQGEASDHLSCRGWGPGWKQGGLSAPTCTGQWESREGNTDGQGPGSQVPGWVTGKQGCCHGWTPGPQGGLRGSQHELPWSFENVSLVHALLGGPTFPGGTGPLLPHQPSFLTSQCLAREACGSSLCCCCPSSGAGQEDRQPLESRLTVERCGFWAGRGREWGLEPSGPPSLGNGLT